jgi:hypothetical protein
MAGWLGCLALIIGSLTITVASAVYFRSDEVPPFMLEKLPLPHENLWLALLRVHVVATSIALPACVGLTSARLRRTWPRLHRYLGRLTGAVVLLALVPSGLYLSLFARGGLPATLGFALSGAIVAFAMVRAVQTARHHDFVAHRRFSQHVLAQLSVAVTSRAMLYLFDAADINANVAYLVSLWLPVLGSAAACELSRLRARPIAKTQKDRRHHEAPAVPDPFARRDVPLQQPVGL